MIAYNPRCGEIARRERMGRAAREKALSFSWTRVAERMTEVYRGITETM